MTEYIQRCGYSQISSVQIPRVALEARKGEEVQTLKFPRVLATGGSLTVAAVW